MASCGCPENSTLNPVTGFCEGVTTQPFTVGDSLKIIPAICQDNQNMVNGTAVYAAITPSQFPVVGQNTLSPSFLDAQSSTITPLSYLTNGPLWISNLAGTQGLLNQRGVGLPAPLNTWYGVNRCVTVAQGDVISFALASRSAFRLYIDGVLAIIHQPLSPGSAYTQLHIFPITLSVGSHTFRAEGLNNKTYLCQNDSTQNGNFLVEVYKNVTAASLALITTQGALNNVYAVTNGAIPQLSAGGNFDVSSNESFGLFYCAQGYVNACTESAFVCTIKTSHPYAPCCYELQNCANQTVIITNTDMTPYLGKIIKAAGFEGCYVITLSDTHDCATSFAITVTDVYDDCLTCGLVYYKLEDCNGHYPDIFTTTDLSQSGAVIKIQGYSDVCWLISGSIAVLNTTVVVETQSFASCEICNYVPPPPIPPNYALAPVALKSRAVQPGYGVGQCDVDVVESVNCNFSNQVYSRLIAQKYGVDQCVEDTYDNWFVKKQLLQLNLIDDPAFCKTTECCAPCGVTVSFEMFNTTTQVQNVVPIPPTQPCLIPDNVVAVFSYQPV